MNEALIERAQMSMDAEYKDIDTLKAEISLLYEQALETQLIYAVKLGRKLTQAKQLLDHGKWGTWVDENLPFSQDKASMMMRIYEAYGSTQESIFGELNSDTYRNLNVSQAFALLKVPEQEREDFVKETHAEDLSVRELRAAVRAKEEAEKARDEALRERDEAVLAKEDAEAEAQEKADALDNARAEQEKLAADAKRVPELQKELEAEQAKAAEARKQADEAKAASDKAASAAKEALEELKRAKEDPQITEEVFEKVRATVEEKERIKVQAELELAKHAAAAAKAENEALKKKAILSSPNVAVFQQLYGELRETQNKLLGALKKVKNEDTGTAEKLINAIEAVEREFGLKVNLEKENHVEVCI